MLNDRHTDTQTHGRTDLRTAEGRHPITPDGQPGDMMGCNGPVAVATNNVMSKQTTRFALNSSPDSLLTVYYSN